MIFRILNIACLMTTSFVLWGCAASFNVSVDSIADPDVTDKHSYILLPGNAGTSVSDLQFREYANYVRKALNRHGFNESSSAEADLAIFIIYGIGDPQRTPYSYSLPIYGKTGGGTTTLSLSSYGTDGYSNTSGTITSKPTYGIVGTTTYSGENVDFFRFLIVDALDLARFRRDSTTAVLWRTMATSFGSSGDLRRVFPVLVGASAEYLGSNTHQRIDMSLTEDDRRVQAVHSRESSQTK
jgi:hypothetical protein